MYKKQIFHQLKCMEKKTLNMNPMLIIYILVLLIRVRESCVSTTLVVHIYAYDLNKIKGKNVRKNQNLKTRILLSNCAKFSKKEL